MQEITVVSIAFAKTMMVTREALINEWAEGWSDLAEVNNEMKYAVDPEDTETVNEYYEHLGEISHRMETAERMVWMLWDIVHSINI